MREIKFRAWCNTKKDFVDPIYNNVNLSHIFELGFYEMEQFTGLNDKNGKEIYEGDICKTTYYNHMEKNSIFTQEVVFENGTFAVKSKNSVVSEIDDWRSFSSLHQFFMPTPNKIEVIGNIHENPELL